MLPLKWQKVLDEQLQDVGPNAGLNVREFASAMRVKDKEVWKLINEGEEAFAARFPHCHFVRTIFGTKRIRNLIFIGNGATNAQKLRQEEQEKVLTIAEFCELQELDRPTLVRWFKRGHQRFKQRFPGWDFYEILDRRGNLLKRALKPTSCRLELSTINQLADTCSINAISEADIHSAPPFQHELTSFSQVLQLELKLFDEPGK